MRFVLPEVEQRLARLEIPFNRDGIDPFGLSRDHLAKFLSMLTFFYRHYFRCTARGVENVPVRGRAMLVGNHSGGYAIDAGMLIASAFLELEPPRLAQGMVEKFLSRMPLAGTWLQRTGQFTGLPEHCTRLLEEERLLMVFPEGARGTAKLFVERYSLVRFGTGFMRLALATSTPIVPFAFLGGGEAVPTVVNLERVGKMVGLPYVPVTPYGLAVPLPVHVELHFGEPMQFRGTGNEDDVEILHKVDDVKRKISTLIDRGLRRYAPT
ncbi:MAG: acyltransferase family protein [Polyangiaceae bacterium]|nr:acyltransferase family protein [Polyangiaceae bacterium]